MWNYLEPELKKRKEEMEADKRFAAKIRTMLFEVIPSGNGNIETVAREMALSPERFNENCQKRKQLLCSS